MATYAIGDVQGCFATLQSLLRCIGFDAASDRLWFCGDLVNRGPASVEVLRFVKSLGEGATTVLGNHDLHLLAIASGAASERQHDTFGDILTAPDRAELLDWLRHRALAHVQGDWWMVHAGVPPTWTPTTTLREAEFARAILQRANTAAPWTTMYGDLPNRWSDDLDAEARFRFAVNAFTRMRCVARDGCADFRFKGSPDDAPANLIPWYATLDPSWHGKTIIAGHWSAAGLRIGDGFALLDTGCVWGRGLTALRLDDRSVFEVDTVAGDIAEGWD